MRIPILLLILVFSLASSLAHAQSDVDLPFGVWVYDSEGNSYRIRRTDEGYGLLPDSLRRATKTQAGMNHVGVLEGKTLLTAFVRDDRKEVVVARSPERASLEPIATYRLENAMGNIAPLSEYRFTEAVTDSQGTVFVQGIDPRGRPVIAYSLARPGRDARLWDIVDYLPVKRLVPLPGKTGAAVLTKDGFVLDLQPGGSASRPQLKVTELNSELNPVQDLTFGVVNGKMDLALIALTAPDPQFEKTAEIRILADGASVERPGKLRNAPRVPVGFEARGFNSNFREFSDASLKRAMAGLQYPSQLRTHLLRTLEEAEKLGLDVCQTYLRMKNSN